MFICGVLVCKSKQIRTIKTQYSNPTHGNFMRVATKRRIDAIMETVYGRAESEAIRI